MSLRRFLLASLLMTLPAPACSTAPGSRGWQSRGESQGFAVEALLTDDFPALIRQWQKTGSPQLEPVGEAKLGGSLNAAFLVSGCRPGPGGRCKVAAEITVKNAAGDVRAKATIDDLCPDQKAPPPDRFALCGRTPAVDNDGRPEKIHLGALVRDLESGRSVHVNLTAEFR